MAGGISVAITVGTTGDATTTGNTTTARDATATGWPYGLCWTRWSVITHRGTAQSKHAKTTMQINNLRPGVGGLSCESVVGEA